MNGSFRQIVPSVTLDAEIRLPPSKSYTNRALVAASLAHGPSIIRNPSASDDSIVMVRALRQFGIEIDQKKERLEVNGSGGIIRPPSREVYVGNAGTALRFLATFASLAPGQTILTGDEQMNRRPVESLVKALKLNGIGCSCAGGFPPLRIEGGIFPGGTLNIDASASSQFLSSLLLASPYAKKPVVIRTEGKLSSGPYIGMTLDVMRSFGAAVTSDQDGSYFVDNERRYAGREIQVESDASSATYFLAAAAITGGRVTIPNLRRDTLQGDLKFISILSDMGCHSGWRGDYLEMTGDKLRGIEVDMNDMPDSVPALAVVAAFAEGGTKINNIRHLRYKETDRLAALAAELKRIGAYAEACEDHLVIEPGELHPAVIETYNDHRIAMSFAVAGLRIRGISIKNPDCVSKSFPDFWNEFKKLEG